MKAPGSSLFLHRPVTHLGWWAFGLTVAFLLMFMINSFVFMPMGMSDGEAGWRQAVLPFYGILMLLTGLAGGILAIIAIMRKSERSWMVWLAILPAAFVLFLMAGELLVPH